MGGDNVMIVMESPVRVRLREKNCIRLTGVKRFHRWYEMLKKGGIDSRDSSAVLAYYSDGIVVFMAADDGVFRGSDMRLGRGKHNCPRVR